jgi:hypothetical protein
MGKYKLALFVVVLCILAAKFLFHIDVVGVLEEVLDFLGEILDGPNQ